MPTHRMNLRGPWQVTGVDLNEAELGAEAGESRRVQLPADWRSLFEETAGTVTFSRNFNRPTNLDDDERVRVVFDGLGGVATVRVNGHALGSVCDIRQTVGFDVTDLLEPANRLEVILTVSDPANASPPQGLHGLVGIEISSENAAED